MIIEVIIPVMDQAGGDLVLTKWLKHEGDIVRIGDVLCELETSKASVEIPADGNGVLRQILIPEGMVIVPLTVIALIADMTEPLPTVDPFYRVKQSALTQSRAPDLPSFVAAQNKPASKGEIIASPRARKLAAEHDIALSTLTGTGPGGRIIEEDVRRVIERGSK